MPEKLKLCGCIGPLTSKTNGSTFYLLRAETPNTFGQGWSTIRWTGVSEKAYAVGSTVCYRVRTMDCEKGEGQFHVC